jgi:hypothetical protein
MSRERSPSPRFKPFSPEASREAAAEILGDPQAVRDVLFGPAEAKAPVPVRLQSNYYWSPFSLFAGLAAGALPALSPSAWKICTVVAVRQLHAGLPSQNASVAPAAISIGGFWAAAHLSRMTVAAAVKEAVESGWLAQEKRRTQHGGNAVALYSINWKLAERAERERRKEKDRRPSR